MTDYSPSILQEIDVRNFFSPPLDYDDLPKARLLLHIEAVEDYVNAVYNLTSAADARIPCLLLIAAKIIQDPALAQKYYTLNYEKLGDYAYALSTPVAQGSAVQSNPYVMAKTWEQMGIQMLEARTTKNWNFVKVNG